MFVFRNQTGEVIAVAAQPQEGWPKEELPEEHVDVQLYLNPPKDYAALRREEYNKRGVTFEAGVEALLESASGFPEKLQELLEVRNTVRAEIPKGKSDVS